MNACHLSLEKSAVRITGDYRPLCGQPAAADFPLVVAIHGGSYTGKYFDVENYSLLARAQALGLPIFALNRPCYADSGKLAPEEASIHNNAVAINEALHELWNDHAGAARGIFVIGHSIGAAVTILLAGLQKRWPLLGIAVSGVGMRCPDHLLQAFGSLPKTPMTLFETHMKDSVMFGPEDTFVAGMPEICHSVDVELPTRELLDINFEWPNLLREAAPLVRVPIHYRQPEFDRLWIVDEDEVSAFRKSFINSPLVDAQLFRSAGHCIDFHRLSAAFHLQQLAFALRCSVTDS